MFKTLLVFYIILLPCFAFAQANIKASLSHNEIAVGQYVTLSTQVSEASLLTQINPDLPRGLEVFSKSISMSASFGSSSESYYGINYIIKATKKGNYTIGPIVVNSGSQKIQSSVFKLKVVENKKNTNQPNYQINSQANNQANYQSSYPQSQMPNQIQSRTQPLTQPSNSGFKVEQILRTPEIYLGQEALLTVRVTLTDNYLRWNIKAGKFASLPNRPLGKNRKSWSVDRRSLILEQDVSLLPSKIGTYTLEPLQIEVTRRNNRSRFSRYTTQNYFSQEAKLKVKALPAAPANFSGLVGQFELKSKLTRKKLKVGESSFLKLSLRGQGQGLDSLEMGTVPDLKLLSVYAEHPEYRAEENKRSRLSQLRQFQLEFVAHSPGQEDIPIVEWVYFDTAQGKYVTLATPKYSIEITGEAKTEKVVSSGIEKPLLKDSIQKTGLEKEENLYYDSWDEYSFYRLNYRWLLVVFTFSFPVVALLFFLKTKKKPNIMRGYIKELSRENKADLDLNFVKNICVKVLSHLLKAESTQLTAQELKDLYEKSKNKLEIELDTAQNLIALIADIESLAYRPKQSEVAQGSVDVENYRRQALKLMRDL